jgi:hypothetical protein
MRLDLELEALDRQQRSLVEELKTMDLPCLEGRPFPGKWSILEIVEHLVLAERAVFQGFFEPSGRPPRERRLGDRIRYLLVMAVLQFRIPARVPSPAMLPTGGRSLAELLQLWDENRDRLKTCAESLQPEDLRKSVFEHPIAGPLSLQQAVRMCHAHIHGHRQQIQERRRLILALPAARATA